MIDADFVAAIAGLQEKTVRIFDGDDETKWFLKDGTLTPVPCVPPALKIATLAGIVAYLEDQMEEPGTRSVVVESPHDVVVVGTPGIGGARPTYIHASVPTWDKSGHWMSLEDATLMLITQFVPSDNTSRLLKLVGNIRDERVITSEDDGVSQVVITRTGVARVGEVVVEMPIKLAPYRTFRELPQPESEFWVRFRQQGDKQLPFVSLHTLGDAWAFEARESIKETLKRAFGQSEIPIFA